MRQSCAATEASCRRSLLDSAVPPDAPGRPRCVPSVALSRRQPCCPPRRGPPGRVPSGGGFLRGGPPGDVLHGGQSPGSARTCRPPRWPVLCSASSRRARDRLSGRRRRLRPARGFESVDWPPPGPRLRDLAAAAGFRHRLRRAAPTGRPCPNPASQRPTARSRGRSSAPSPPRARRSGSSCTPSRATTTSTSRTIWTRWWPSPRRTACACTATRSPGTCSTPCGSPRSRRSAWRRCSVHTSTRWSRATPAGSTSGTW